MCLQQITKTEGLKDGYGYKVFTISKQGKLRCAYAWILPKTNKWIKAEENKPHLKRSGLAKINSYKPAWHIYLNKKDARKTCMFHDRRIRGVKYRKPTTLGIDRYGSRVIVAKEIRILKEVA